ncbi:MAG: DNA polymerase III subunit gamma/tau [Bdellovibrionales bacterium]
MSNRTTYQVMARKWRPQSFEEMVGQNHVSQTIRNALKSGRLPHALLFTGPRGVGKTSSARILAKSLKCQNAKDFVPCNECSTCQEIAAGACIDVMEIDGASHNGVDSIRELRETIGYMPSTGKYKVYIIDEVHMLSVSAFNALLKTLEEPPAHVIFIFATTEPQKIPLTILSRVQRFDFRRIPTRLLTEQLQKICKAENVKAEPEALWLIARQSDGSARDSQSLLDQIVTFCDSNVTLQKTIEVLGLTDRQILLDTLSALVSRSSMDVLDVVSRIYKSGADIKNFSQELLEEIRHLLMVKLAPKEMAQIVDLPESEITALRELGKDLSQEDIHLLFDMALKGVSDLTRSQDPRLALEMMLLRMSIAPQVGDLMSVLQGSRTANAPVSRGGGGSSGSSKPTPKAPPATVAVPEKPVTLSISRTLPLKERWEQTVLAIKASAPPLAAKLDYVAALEDDGKTLRLSVAKDKQFLLEQILKLKPDIEQKLSVLWESPVHIDAVLADTTTATQVVSPMETRQKQMKDEQNNERQEVENHPFIQKTKEIFRSEIRAITKEPL